MKQNISKCDPKVNLGQITKLRTAFVEQQIKD